MKTSFGIYEDDIKRLTSRVFCCSPLCRSLWNQIKLQQLAVVTIDILNHIFNQAVTKW